MEKLRFKFTIQGTSDGKSNQACITSIETPDGRVFKIPDELQPVEKHTYIANSNIFVKIKKSLTKRHQVRNLWIPVDDEIRKIYLDEGENLQFGEYYLEEVTQHIVASNENVVPKIQNLAKITEKFLIEKFSLRISNARQWIEEFEKECQRFEVLKDEEKIEALKHVLEKQCLDWYASMLIKFTVNSDWLIWKKRFCETYEKKGWSKVKYAFTFKYQAGPLLEYATKKEKLLLELNKSIDTDTLINLIVLGLPEDVMNRIDKESLNSTSHLYNEINKYEYLINKKNEKINLEYKGNFEATLRKSKQKCSICEKLNKGVRFHSESSCWFKTKEKNKQIKLVNNSELECELQDENKKNF
jgi:hypothetical protein